MKQRIAKELKASALFDKVSVVLEFPPTAKPAMLQLPCVCVGFEQAALSDAALGGAAGQDGITAHRCSVTVRFTVCSAPRSASSVCPGLFDALVERFLLEKAEGLPFRAFRCGQMRFDKTLGCTAAEVQADLELYFIPSQPDEGPAFRDFRLEGPLPPSV